MIGKSSDFGLPPPHPLRRFCVVVPVRNEEARLPSLIVALANQRDLSDTALDPTSYELLLLLNNCTDRTGAIARELQQQLPRLQLHFVEIAFAPHEAHVGRARQWLFDLAFHRFRFNQRPHGLILTTDADSCPAPDWIAQTEAEIINGVEGVGGRVLLEPAEQAAMPRAVRRLFLLDIGYRRALEEMRGLYAPELHDSFPRHHQHFGGSLAVTAAAYGRAGGMPLRRSSEDVALHQAIIESGGKFRHSYGVRVYTSARASGRAEGGLADAINWWQRQALDRAPVMVENASAADARLRRLGIWCLENSAGVPPSALVRTPEPTSPHHSAEIHETLRALRDRIEILRPLSLAERLESRQRQLEQDASVRALAA